MSNMTTSAAGNSKAAAENKAVWLWEVATYLSEVHTAEWLAFNCVVEPRLVVALEWAAQIFKLLVTPTLLLVTHGAPGIPI